MDERLGHGDLVDGVFGEGDADGVADTVGEEGADADGGFDASVLAIACFGDSEVDGIIPIRAFSIEPCHEEAVGLDHDFGVGGFHGENEVVVIVFPGDAGELEGAFAHTKGGIAIAVHDPIRKGAVVGSDAHGASEILAEKNQRGELLTDALEFLLVLGIRVFADFEFLFIRIVAGIDADFLDPYCGLHGGVGFEMDIRHQRHWATGGTHLTGDVFQVRGVDFGLGGDADDFTTGPRECQNLSDTGRGIAGVRGDHRLDTDRVVATDSDMSHHDLPGFPTGAGKQVWAVGERVGSDHVRAV